MSVPQINMHYIKKHSSHIDYAFNEGSFEKAIGHSKTKVRCFLLDIVNDILLKVWKDAKIEREALYIKIDKGLIIRVESNSICDEPENLDLYCVHSNPCKEFKDVCFVNENIIEVVNKILIPFNISINPPKCWKAKFLIFWHKDSSIPVMNNVSQLNLPEVRPGSFLEFRNSMRLVDGVIQVEGIDHPIHMFALGVKTDYFKTMFTGDMQESSQKIIVLKHEYLSSEIFSLILDYIYDVDVDWAIFELEKLFAMIRCTDFLLVDSMKKECIQHISDRISIENVFSIVLLAEEMNLGDLIVNCQKWAIKHKKEFNSEDLEENESYEPEQLETIAKAMKILFPQKVQNS